MCYYPYIVYACQDWEWGELSRYCTRGDNSLGVPCGLKLADKEKTEVSERCGLCQDLQNYYGQRMAKVVKFKKWERESASDRSEDEPQGTQLLEDILELNDKIKDLHVQRIKLQIEDESFLEDDVKVGHIVSGLKKRRMTDDLSSPILGPYSSNIEARDIGFSQPGDSPELAQQSLDPQEYSAVKVLCPYYLRHPQKHQTGSCMGPGFDTMARLK
jgi:hypothetical protein